MSDLEIRFFGGGIDYSKWREITQRPKTSRYNPNYEFYPPAIKHGFVGGMCHQNSSITCPDSCQYKQPFVTEVTPWDGGTYFVLGFEKESVGEVCLFPSGHFGKYYEVAYEVASNFRGNLKKHPDELLTEIYNHPRFAQFKRVHSDIERFKKNKLRSAYIYMTSKDASLVIPMFNLITNKGIVQGGLLHALIGHHPTFQPFYRDDISKKTPFDPTDQLSTIIDFTMRLFFDGKKEDITDDVNEGIRCRKIYCGSTPIRDFEIKRFSYTKKIDGERYKLITELNPITKEESLITMYRLGNRRRN
jgi:hypothetical protein